MDVGTPNDVDVRVVDDTLIRVAWYYYKDRLTQAEIAARMGVSRASVGRYLERARESGVVTITIDPRFLRTFELARGLADGYGLVDAVVVPDLAANGHTAQTEINERIAVGAAQYLTAHVSSGQTLGVGYGDTVARMLAECNLSVFDGVSMVTLTGGIDAYLRALLGVRSDGILNLAQNARIIPTPIFASTVALADALRSEQPIREVIDSAARADVAVVGIGAVTPEATLVRLGYQSQEELEAFYEEGLVGDILGLFYDEDGRFRDLRLNARRIGIAPEQLMAIDRVIGVAGGAAKIPAIRGALRGRLLDVLITTEDVARTLVGELSG